MCVYVKLLCYEYVKDKERFMRDKIIWCCLCEMMFMKRYCEKDFIKPYSFRHSFKHSSFKMRCLGQVEKKVEGFAARWPDVLKIVKHWLFGQSVVIMYQTHVINKHLGHRP